MKIGIITQARTTSTRLPGKVLLKINEKTLLEYHLQRLKESGLEVFVATTTNNEDDPIVDIAEQNKFKYYRGSELDVLKRYYECAKLYELDVIIRATSDCPLIDGNLINDAIIRYKKEGHSRVFIANTIKRTYPRGFDFSVFSFELLKEAHERVNELYFREHVTPYMIQNIPGDIAQINISQNINQSNLRLTVDTPDDFRLISTLIEEYKCDYKSASEITKLLIDNRDLSDINKDVTQKGT